MSRPRALAPGGGPGGVPGGPKIGPFWGSIKAYKIGLYKASKRGLPRPGGHCEANLPLAHYGRCHPAPRVRGDCRIYNCILLSKLIKYN